MKDFGQWFKEQSPIKEPVEWEELPEGVICVAEGVFEAQCCGCSQWTELPCDPSEIPLTGYRHFCGGSPYCCP